MKRNITSLLIVCAIILVGAGCGSTRPRAWNVSITKKTTASIQVDLIGVASQNEESFLSGVSADDYWKPDSRIREDQRKLGNLMSKSLVLNQPWIVNRNDPQWQTWLDRGVTKLYVIARLPEATGDWKVPLLLAKGAWSAKNHTLEVVVVDSGISIQTKAKD